jgi:hypothetical protein
MLQHEGMPLIQVRDVPEHIYRALTHAAARERRSLAQQVVAVLARGLQVEVDAKTRRKRLLEGLPKLKPQVVKRLTDPMVLIREDRAR